jgi:type IX secretion system PorP/SprF family membrane protein
MKKLILLLLTLNFISTKAQDVIFSQSFLAPETLNSSFTGILNHPKVGSLHKSQFTDYGVKINTHYAYYDTWFDRFNTGIGVAILNHQEVNSNYNYSQLNFNYSLAFKISEDWYFRPSISTGIGIKSFGFQNLLLEDQINISNNSIDSSSDPLMFQNKRTFFDFNSSILFHNEDSWFGVTLRHLNKPNISLTNNDNMPLDIFMSIHAKYYFPIFESGYSWLAAQSKFYILSNFIEENNCLLSDLFIGLVPANMPKEKVSSNIYCIPKSKRLLTPCIIKFDKI